MNPIVEIGRRDGHVLTQPERVVLIDPGVVAGLDAELRQVLEAGTRKSMEGPALRAVVSGRGRSVQRALALPAIEFTEMTAPE